MCKNKNLLSKKFSLILVYLIGTVYAFLQLSCNSMPSDGTHLVENQDFVELPIVYKKSLNKRISLDLIEYKITTQDILDSVVQGRVDLPDRFVYSQRKIFRIADNNNRFIDAESMFVFTREGFDSGTVESALFFGRTGQDEFPFTISLVADELTRVFSGKSKRLRVLLHIEGTPYTRNGLTPNKTETGFYIRQDGDLLAFVDFMDPAKVYIKRDLNTNIRKTVLYTIAFLFQFERYSKYKVNSKLIKGE